jgi:ribonucleotide reductase alpha subunit
MATTRLRSTLAERAAANPLPAHGVYVLGSLNVAAFVRDAFTRKIAFKPFEQTAAIAVRMLDDAVDLSLYPFALEESVLSPSANGCRAPLRYRL